MANGRTKADGLRRGATRPWVVAFLALAIWALLPQAGRLAPLLWADEATAPGDATPGDKSPDETPSADAPPAQAEKAPSLATAERQVLDRFSDLEKKLLRMAELTAATDPHRAALLRKAVAQSQQQGIESQLAQLVELLGQDRLEPAIKNQANVGQDLNKLLELLLSEDRSKRLQSEKERIARYIQRVNGLIKQQKQLQGQAAGEADLEEIAKSQGQLAEKTGQLGRDLEESEAGKADKGKAGSDADSDDGKAPGKGAKPSGGKGKAQRSADKPGAKKPGDEKPSDEKPANEGPADSPNEKNADDKPDGDKPGGKMPADGKPAGEQPSEEEPQDENSSGDKPADGKSANGKPSDGKPAEGDKPGDANSEPKPGDAGQPADGKPADGKPSESGGKPGESRDEKPADETPAPDEQPGDKPAEGEQKNPVHERVAQAEQKMREAQKKLAEALREQGIKKQEEAKRELERAKAELEAILRQLREEEVGRTLAMLEARFRKMLEMQNQVNTGTQRLDKVPQEERDHDDEIEAGRLSRQEAAIVVEANKALAVLHDEGSAVAFPEAVTDLRDDMEQVVVRLAQSKVDGLTQGLEHDIVVSLEEMIAAFHTAQKQKGPPPKGAASGSDHESPLVDDLSEIKMIRSMQVWVNDRTKRYTEMSKNETADSPDVIDALRRLADREQRIHRVTRDIVVGRNK